MADFPRSAQIDAIILKCVDEIWVKFDVDFSGALDKEETKCFVKCTLNDFSGGDAADDSFNDEGFEKVFEQFDKDGLGTI